MFEKLICVLVGMINIDLFCSATFLFCSATNKKTTHIMNSYADIHVVATKINVDLNTYDISYLFVFKYIT